MRGAFIHVVSVWMLLAVAGAAPGSPDTPPEEPQTTLPFNCSKETLLPCIALNGTCMDQYEICEFKNVVQGASFCGYSEKCKCCFPPPWTPAIPPVVIPRTPPPTDCSIETLPPCLVMNGTCMGQYEWCDGIEFANSLFCNYTDTCKCCYPTPPPSPMPRTPKPNVTMVCPDGMELIGGCCYSFKIAQKNWTEAETHCKTMGDLLNKTIGLAEVETVEACDPLKLREAIVDKENDVWLGACFTGKTRDGWMWWETKKTLTRSNKLWGQGEPKIDGGECLKAHIYTTHSGKHAYFKNAKCTVSKHFVCQLF